MQAIRFALFTSPAPYSSCHIHQETLPLDFRLATQPCECENFARRMVKSSEEDIA